MLETIKFELTAKMAIIKKPESNETYYTYNFPHKIMLLGILGAIIGLNGYNYYALKKYLGKATEELPEFYLKLRDLKIGITPKIEYKNFNKKIQTFNNSVGYASKEDGNNLIVKEQWLENPCWEIYILENNSEEYKKIKEYLLNKKCEYIPYIGKNDHFADIKKVEIIETNLIKETKCINSIFDKKISEEIDDFEELFAFTDESKIEYEYKEVLPTKLSHEKGYYQFEEFIFTNKKLNIIDKTNLYEVEKKVVYYF